jgi:hypothetical protein
VRTSLTRRVGERATISRVSRGSFFRLARVYLEQPGRLNPLSPEVKEAAKVLDAQTGPSFTGADLLVVVLGAAALVGGGYGLRRAVGRG